MNLIQYVLPLNVHPTVEVEKCALTQNCRILKNLSVLDPTHLCEQIEDISPFVNPSSKSADNLYEIQIGPVALAAR